MNAKWTLLGIFVPLIFTTQYSRLQAWIEVEELEDENAFLRERLPRDVVERVCAMAAPADAVVGLGSSSQLLSALRSAAATAQVWAPGNEERSGVPTLAFLFLTGIYLWRIYRWVASEMALYARLEKQQNDADRSRYSLANFFSYRADFWLSTNTYAKPLALGTFTLVLILVGALLRTLLSAPTVGTSLWECWIFVVDTSAHADEEAVSARLTALLMTVGGMFIFAMMIGLISDGLAAQVDALHNGSADVLECGHIVVLGWSNKLLPMVSELALANESAGGCVIAILAEKEKADMEARVEASGIDLRGCKIVCRKGTPTVRHDLEHVSVKSAKAFIVLSPASGDRPQEADEADGFVLRVLLCLKGIDCRGHVVAELQDVDNQALTHIVGGAMLETVVAHDFIGRLIVQSGRQPGLAQVMEALLGFGGHEFYMKVWPELVGSTFGDVLFQFEEAIPLGVVSLDEICVLNPEDDYVLREGDVLIVLAEDDDTYRPAPQPLRTSADVRKCPHRYTAAPAGQPENALIVGWRRDLGDVLAELNDNLPPGSKVTLFCSRSNKDGSRDQELQQNGRSDPSTFGNIRLEHVEGNPVCRYDLERLDLGTYRTAFILHEEGQGSQEADSCIVTSLFLLRDVHQRQMAAKGEDATLRPLTIISEVLDPRTRHQLAMAGVHDYVMSNEVVSMALAMVAECRPVNRILKELLSGAGCEIYIRPVGQYCDAGFTPLSFLDMMVIVRRARGILVGQLLAGKGADLNPSRKHEPRLWSPEDKLIVLAED